MSDLDLFPSNDPPVAAKFPLSRTDLEGDTPLAARMRPRNLDEFHGQDHLIAPGKPLRSMIDQGKPGSMILWGPPGSGKTTLAHIIAERTKAVFIGFSAVTEGVARVRKVITEAENRRSSTSRSTILFCDEIHRFNRAQQDAFLPHVENGTVVLIGATTENPSFRVVRPLLSRAPVFVLEPLTAEVIGKIMGAALGDERGLSSLALDIHPDALETMIRAADGDARRALGILETAANLVGLHGVVDRTQAEAVIQHRFAIYDPSGEEHFNTISALHKAVRGGDPDGALYWLARMIEGGEDQLYIARRLIRMASEDVGLADPTALSIAVAARDAFHFLGAPEGELALAEVAVYLASAPKSNRTYVAWEKALQSARDSPSAPVPLHIRNAPTVLMEELGYGEEYRYDPDEPGGVSAQEYLPEEVTERVFYRPGSTGFEQRIKERLDRWREQKDTARQSELNTEEPPFPRS